MKGYNIQDRYVLIFLSSTILTYLLVLILGYFGNKLTYVIGILNLATAVSILIYWIQKQLKIKQHIIESREITVLCFELIVIVGVTYALIAGHYYHWLKVMQFIVFGLHLLALIIGLIFMLTFKIKRLI